LPLAGSGKAAGEFVRVLRKVAADVTERELRLDRGSPLALKEEAEGLPYDSLQVVAEFDAITEPLGHGHPVGRLTLTFAHLDPELPGRQATDADVCHGSISRAAAST
jgi:hypothetical protein